MSANPPWPGEPRHGDEDTPTTALPYWDEPAGGPSGYGPTPGYGATPGYGQPPGYGPPATPGYGGAYGSWGAGAGPAPAPYPQFGTPYGPAGQQTGRTNGLAVAALVCGLASFFLVVTAPVAVVLGHIASGQCKRRGEQGRGMAIAGYVIGYVYLAFLVLIVGLFVALAASSSSG